ncbi:MAG: TetR/AcrR family transcriptional regulator [Panacagrimonas sp.]
MEPANPKIWRKRPKQDRSENTANVILLAAEEMFAARGFHHTTSDDIAQRAGVGVGSLYDYFPNKAAIALALLERTAQSVAGDSRKFLVENGTEAIEVNLPKVIRGLYEGYKRHRRVLIDLVAEVSELRAAGVYTMDRLIFRASLMYLQQYQDRYPDIDLQVTHAFLIHLFTSSVKHYLAAPDAPLSEDEFLTRLSEVIVGYLVNPRNVLKKPASPW